MRTDPGEKWAHSLPAAGRLSTVSDMPADTSQPVLAPPVKAGGADRLSPSGRRLIALAILAVTSAVLSVALLVSPAEAGLGTHRQLNLPECGWITVADLPCFTCGMTTSFAHAVRGNLLASMLAQPAGFLLAILTAMALLLSLHVAVTGSNLGGFFLRLWSPRLLWVTGLVVLAGWVFKVVMYKEWFG